MEDQVQLHLMVTEGKQMVCNAVVAAATHVKTWDFFTSPSHLLFVIKFSMRNPTITTVFNLDT